jgi:predicted outer membrane repeat protein
MGSEAWGSEGTFRSFIASTFNFADCLRLQASRPLVVVVLLLALPVLVSGQVAAHFCGAQIALAPNAFSLAGSIATDSSGNLFVADISAHQIYEMQLSSGVYSAPVALSLGGFMFVEPKSVAADAAGNLYVADCGGSPSAVYKVTYSPGYASSAVTPIGNGSGNPFNCPNSVAVDAAGDVFVADAGNGNAGTSWAYEIASGSNIATPLGGGGFVQAFGIVVDGVGDVFVSDQGSVHIGVFEIPISNPSTIVQVGTSGTAFQLPSGMAFNKYGDLLVADAGSNVNGVLRLSASSSFGSVSVAYTMPTVQNPTGLAIDLKGNFYLTGGSSVYQVIPSGANLGTVNANPSVPFIASMVFNFDAGGAIGQHAVLFQGASTGDFEDANSGTCAENSNWSQGQSCSVDVYFQPTVPGVRMGAVELLDTNSNILATGYMSGVGVAPEPIFSPASLEPLVGGGQVEQVGRPQGIAVDEHANLFFTDFTNQTVQELPYLGNSVATLMSSTSGLGTPEDVAVDGAGNVFVADSGNNTIWMLPYDSPTKTFGSPIAVGSGFSSPGSVAVDGGGNLFIADTDGHRVVELPWQATGGYGSAIQVNCAQLGLPYSVALDDSGNIYTADFDASQIVIDPAGGCKNPAQETVIANHMHGPTSAVVDHNGNIYVASYYDGNVLEFTPGDFANPQVLYSGSLTNPFGLAFDGWGNLYISDAGSATISEVTSWSPWVDFPNPTAPGTTDLTDGPQSTTITNFGNAPLVFTSIITAAAPDFQLAGGSCQASGFSLRAGQSCNLSFEFSPLSAGNLVESVSITDNSKNQPGVTQSISLYGDAVATASSLAVSGFPASQYLGVAATVTITALDQNGSPTASGAGTVTLSTPGDPYAMINNNFAILMANGVATANVVFETPGPQTIVATIGSVTGQQTSIQINPVNLVVTGYPSPQQVGATGTVTISATDPSGNPLPTFQGMAAITTSDPQAVINSGQDSAVTLLGDTATATVAFATAGTQSITASGSLSGAGMTSASQTGISITAPPNFVVNTDGDSGAGAQDCPANPSASGPGSCTLRDALAAAANTGSGNITFDSSVFSSANSAAQNTIQLQANVDGGLNISSSFTSITGPTPTTVNGVLTPVVTVDGQAAATIFTVNPGVAGAVIANLAIANGTPGSSKFGGGILNNGALSVSNSTFVNDTALDWGGAIYNAAQATGLTVTNCLFTANSAAFGGAIASYGQSATIVTSTFANNSTTPNAEGRGGAIYSTGNLSITGSSFLNNTTSVTTHGAGGAIFSSGVTTISASTFSGNSASSSSTSGGGNQDHGGGAILNAGGTLSISGTTFFGNSATAVNPRGNPAGRGGAIANHGNGTLSIVNSTITGNWANEYGGGIYVQNGTSNLANTVVDGNWLGISSTPASYDDYDDQTGNSVFTGGSSDGGGNVFGYYNAGFADSQPAQPASPAINLAPLSNYGGPTPTMIPLPGSPAICAGTATPGLGLALPATDQRGNANTNTVYAGYSGGTPCVDSGAVQTNYALSFSTEPSDASVAANFAAAVTLTESGNAFRPAVTIPLTLTGAGTLTGGSATTSSGVAAYTLQVDTAGSGDTLTAKLALDGSVTPQAAIAATSSSFSVGTTTTTPAVALTLSSNTTTYRTEETFTATLPSDATGTVTFLNNGVTVLGTGVLSGGIAAFSSSTLNAGTYNVTASYPGDSKYHAAGSSPQTLTVNKGEADVVLSGLSQTYTGSALSATASTNPASLAVSLTYNGSSTAPRSAGSYAVVGTINDANYSGTASGTMTIAKAAATVSLSNLSQTYTGSALSATATTNPASLAVSFTYNGSSIAPTTAGSYAVVATINDANYSGSASGTLVVSTAASAVSLTSSANPVALMSAVTLTATVSSTVGAPAGQVSFADGTTLLGSTTISSGVATLSTSALTSGAHSITAVYQGNVDFGGSSSSVFSLTVIDYSVGSAGGSGSGGGSGQSQTTTPGGTVSYTVPLAPSAGTTFPSLMTLTVAGLPSGATATLSTPGWTQQSPTSWTLPANQPVGNVSLTFQVPAQSAAVQPADGPARKLPLIALGILLLPFARQWRKAGRRMSRLFCLALIAAGMAALIGATGCGGSAHSSNQPQTYTLTVTVTSGALTHSTQLTLNVE